jgi:glutamate-1-semialdehyde aminotransferase
MFPAAPLATQRTPQQQANDLARAKVMALALAELLNKVAGARDVLPHLSALEAALRERGLASLEQASVPVLSKICTQLASLPVADDDAPLQDLQTRLLDAMDRRTRPKNLMSTMGNDQVIVAEISHSAFMAAANGEERTEPMQMNPAR